MNCEKEKENTTTLEQQEQAYLATLNERERQGYEIARSHLGMSFSLYKSNGFLAWKKEQQQQQQLK